MGSGLIKTLEEHKFSIMRASLEVAGFRPSDLRLAMQRTREALSAKKVVIATADGVISDERAYVDHGTRLDAADRVFKMVSGVYAQQDKGNVNGTFTVEVVTMGAGGEKTLVRVIGKE